ncbi:MAG TPA: hypothetical protein VFY71_07565 [Planctomycetota bacterium]|nr:hypothetical protein [Planctomycetota bacterium]
MGARGPVTWVACAGALAAGLAIAWVDSRPTWDDTGISAAALFVASGLAARLGVTWWVAALLVGGPLVVAEWGGVGVGLLIPPGIALVGAVLGALMRRTSS